MKKTLTIISIFFISINLVSAKETVKFSKCVDGDTIKITIKDKEYTVRMLAVDTPESVHPTKEIEYYGKEASEYTCKRVTNAKKIALEYDDNSDKTDKYDRLLAWVFVDDSLLQEELIEKGYAKVAYLYDDYKYTNILKEKQELAQAKKIGIWNDADKEKYNKENTKKTKTTEEEKNEEYTTKEIVIIVALLLILVFSKKATTKKKAKKKLKKMLK